MNFWKHFCTVTRHRFLVLKGCFAVGLYWQGLIHDLSKFSITEFRIGRKYYQGMRSPNNAEREEVGYSSAWLHHKGRNKHHFEYWVDYSTHKRGTFTPVEMPKKYVVEMVMDRIAACKVYDKADGKEYDDSHAYAYYSKGKDHTHIHENTSALLEELLSMLAEKGEKETFSYIRKHVLKNKSNLLRRKL